MAATEAYKRKRQRTTEKSSPEKQNFKRPLSAKKFQKESGNAPPHSGRTPVQKKTREEKIPAKASKLKQTGTSVLIKVSKGKTYADVLGKLRKEVNPDVSGAMAVSARVTQKGDIY